ncbi:endonuclease NucS [Paraburkholderia sp. A2RI-6]|uniref:endonuclease NucS domain-containing protein n=1 Tax=Paraburkholderia sp. A2RI-6 TaxID=3028371 RepID=UPI003B77FB49
MRADATSITVNANSRVHYGAGKKLGEQIPEINTTAYIAGKMDATSSTFQKSMVFGKLQKIAKATTMFKEFQNRMLTPQPMRSLEAESIVCDAERNSASSRFAMESHLRDYLAQNLNRIEGLPTQLDLYRDDSDMPAIEYRTSVGYIDILTKGADGAFYVLELKLARGSDAVIGQILRYMAWVRTNLAKGSPRYGVVVASGASDKLKYAASEVPGILLMTSRNPRPMDVVIA